MRAILTIQEVKYKLVYLTRLFIASLTLRLHSTEQCIHKHIQITQQKNICTEKLHNANYMQAFDHMFITNNLTGSLQYDSVF